MELQNRFLDTCASIALKALGKADKIYQEGISPHIIPSFLKNCTSKNPFTFLNRLETLEKKVNSLEKEKVSKQSFPYEKESDI